MYGLNTSRLCWVQLRWFYHQRRQMTSVCLGPLITTTITAIFHDLIKECLFYILLGISWWCIFIVYYRCYALSFVFIVLMIMQDALNVIAKVIRPVVFSMFLRSTWHVTTFCWWIKHDLLTHWFDVFYILEMTSLQ